MNLAGRRPASAFEANQHGSQSCPACPACMKSGGRSAGDCTSESFKVASTANGVHTPGEAIPAGFACVSKRDSQSSPMKTAMGAHSLIVRQLPQEHAFLPCPTVMLQAWVTGTGAASRTRRESLKRTRACLGGNAVAGKKNHPRLWATTQWHSPQNRPFSCQGFLVILHSLRRPPSPFPARGQGKASRTENAARCPPLRSPPAQPGRPAHGAQAWNAPLEVRILS